MPRVFLQFVPLIVSLVCFCLAEPAATLLFVFITALASLSCGFIDDWGRNAYQKPWLEFILSLCPLLPIMMIVLTALVLADAVPAFGLLQAFAHGGSVYGAIFLIAALVFVLCFIPAYRYHYSVPDLESVQADCVKLSSMPLDNSSYKVVVDPDKGLTEVLILKCDH